MLKNWTLRLPSVFQFIGSEVNNIVDKKFSLQLIVAYLTPFLIVSKIGCPFPLSLKRRKASLTVDRLQQGEPSLFGSSSAQ